MWCYVVCGKVLLMWCWLGLLCWCGGTVVRGAMGCYGCVIVGGSSLCNVMLCVVKCF